MIDRRLAPWCLLVWLMLPLFAHAANAHATIDRDSVALGETVTLNLRIQGDAGNSTMPDLSVLNGDFDVMGTSQSSSLSIVNGAATSELTLGIELRPRHAGLLTIPPMDIAGSRTAALRVNVTSAAQAPPGSTTGNRDVFMESQIEPDHAYVGQQLSYVVRLFIGTPISNGAIDTLQVNGLQVSQNGDDLNYVVERGGRRYRVLERRFALVAQHAGQFDIPALNFQGVAFDPSDPDTFFGARKPLSAQAPGVSFNVKPTPADWGNTAWLPARSLNLTLAGLPGEKESVRVGQPLNLTMTLQATGLPAAALPALSLPPMDGATVYPDKVLTTDRNDGPWAVGQRQQAFAIVPTRAGTLSIPATTVKWWDVLNNRAAVAEVPARQFTVLPAIGATDVHTANPAVAATTAAGHASTDLLSPVAAESPWRWIALGSFGLWLLSMIGWLLWRRRRRQPAAARASADGPVSAREAQQTFLQAARAGDSAVQARTLLAWARTERPTVLHLGDLSSMLADEKQRAAIATLQQRNYATGVAAGNDPGLSEAFVRGFHWRVQGGKSEDVDLPPLYPFKLD